MSTLLELRSQRDGIRVKISILRHPRTEDVLAKFSHACSDSKGKTHLHLLQNSGHWVNVDNPDGLFEIFEKNLIFDKKSE